jgi:hypothetical protein
MKSHSIRFFGAMAACVGLLVSSESLSAQVQPSGIHSQSTPPSDARYEIVESSLTVRDTFRLDRFTGRVWRIVSNGGGDDLWEEMTVENRPEVGNSSTARFQVFLSGLAVRYSLLLDTQTGETWEITKSKIDPNGGEDESNVATIWAPIAVRTLAQNGEVPTASSDVATNAVHDNPNPMDAAWSVFMSRVQASENPADAAEDWKNRIAAYFPGRSIASITQAEWARFAADGFVSPPTLSRNSAPSTAPSEWDKIAAPQR